MICDFLRIWVIDDSMLEFSDLMIVTLRDDDIQRVDIRWDDLFSYEEYLRERFY